MAAVFKDTAFNFGGAFPANKGVITSIGGTLSGVLMQSMDVRYQQQVQRIYELGIAQKQTSVYFVGAKPSGNVSVNHIMGPGVALAKYFTDFGDMCNANHNHLQINLSGQICNPDAQGGNNFPACVMTAGLCTLNNVGFSTNVGNMLINVGSGVEFANLDYTGA
jgi:hypothetical protein